MTLSRCLKRMNKNKFLIAFLLFACASVVQVAAQKNKFVKAQDPEWLVSVDEAYLLSKKTNKPILANFTGSDWCGWCKRLRAEVFTQPEFKAWAAENVVLLELDFPKRKQLPEVQKLQNQQLQKAFRVTGFPTIWVFGLEKPEGSNQFSIVAYGKTGYVRGGTKNFTKEIEQLIANAKGG